jgi:hypothetical protein
VKFRYKPCWADPSEAVERNNPQEYKSAWIELVSLFTQARGNGHLKLTPQFKNELNNAVKAIQTPCHLENGGTGRKSSANAWLHIFGDAPVKNIDADAEPDANAVLDGMIQATDRADRYGTDYVNVSSDLYLFQIAADYHFHFVKSYLQRNGIYRYTGSWSQQESALSPAVASLFTENKSSNLRKTELAGGGGTSFDDVPVNTAAIKPITKIVIRSGEIIDQLAVSYGSEIRARGGTGGGETMFEIAPG